MKKTKKLALKKETVLKLAVGGYDPATESDYCDPIEPRPASKNVRCWP